jgi:GNAT superfamily N-acetyltransferase
VKLPDDVWQTMKDYMQQYRGITPPETLRQWVEDSCDVELHDGVAFVAIGNEFDLFVTPEKRGKWNPKKVISEYLDRMSKAHKTIVIKIYDSNARSLSLADFFGFAEVSRNGNMIRLEKTYG